MPDSSRKRNPSRLGWIGELYEIDDTGWRPILSAAPKGPSFRKTCVRATFSREAQGPGCGLQAVLKSLSDSGKAAAYTIANLGEAYAPSSGIHSFPPRQPTLDPQRAIQRSPVVVRKKPLRASQVALEVPDAFRGHSVPPPLPLPYSGRTPPHRTVLFGQSTRHA